MTTVYACSGSCHGVVTEETYKSGKTTCGSSSCEKFEQPFVKKVQCESCEQAAAKDQEAHVCENCSAE